jgi:hypothetical protein
MARIRVDTEDLKAKAKDFESAADAFNRAGDEIAALAMAMPSYDGQLSGPARKAGYEIQSQAREMKTALTNNALFLQKAGQDFERVENATIEVLNASSTSVRTSMFAAGDGGDIVLKYQEDGPLIGLKDFIGYKQDGWILTIYCNGKSVSFDIRYIDGETENKLKEFMSLTNTAEYQMKYSPEALAFVLAVKKVVDMGFGWCISFFVGMAQLIPGYEDMITTATGVEGNSLSDYIDATKAMLIAYKNYTASYKMDMDDCCAILQGLSGESDIPGRV